MKSNFWNPIIQFKDYLGPWFLLLLLLPLLPSAACPFTILPTHKLLQAERQKGEAMLTQQL